MAAVATLIAKGQAASLKRIGPPEGDAAVEAVW